MELSELTADIAQEHVSLLFVKMANCGVCDATFEKTKELLQSYTQVPFMVVSIEKIPRLSGEFLIFTAPTILLLREGGKCSANRGLWFLGSWKRHCN